VRRAEQLRYLVLAAQREGNRQLLHALAPLSLTPSQAEVLRIVGDYAPLSVSALGGLLVCESGTNPSRLVERLVTAGLILRQSEPGDRRQVALSLTDAGRAAEASVREIEEALYASIDGVLSGSTADTADLLELLRRLTAGSPSGRAYGNRVTGIPKRR